MTLWDFIQMNWPAILCLLLGLALLIFEMFTPGFAAPGILGIILLVVSVVLYAKTLVQALVMVLILLVILSVAFALAMHSAARGRLYRSPLVNKASAEDYLSTSDMSYFVGKTGVARTPLRPVGNADFDGVQLDVVSRGEYIERGTPVVVVEVEGRRIVVKPIQPQQSRESTDV